MEDKQFTDSPLNADQTDALQEIVNIGMGRAGEQLANIFDNFVELSIPKIVFSQADKLAETISNIVNPESDISAVRQGFFSHWQGEAIAIFSQPDCNQLAHQMGYREDINNDLEMELLLDVSNILIGACLNGIAHQLGLNLNYSQPALMCKHSPISSLFDTSSLGHEQVLVLEVFFKLENVDFTAHLVMIMAEGSISQMRQDLDAFLENI